MKTPLVNIARGLAVCLAAGALLVACGGESDNSAEGINTKLLANGEACNTAWASTQVYVAGNKVSYQGVNYTAAYWTQGDSPLLKHGPQGSGQPWINGFTCGPQTTTTSTTTSTSSTTTTTNGPSAITLTASVVNNSISYNWTSNLYTNKAAQTVKWYAVVDATDMALNLPTVVLSTGCNTMPGCVPKYQDSGKVVVTDAVPVASYVVSVRACNAATPAVCITSNSVPINVTVAPKTLGLVHLHVDPTSQPSTSGTVTTTSSTTPDTVEFSMRAMIVDSLDPIEVNHNQQVKLSWGHETFRPAGGGMFPTDYSSVPDTIKVLDNGQPIVTTPWDYVRNKVGYSHNCHSTVAMPCQFVSRTFGYPLINSLAVGQHKLTVLACKASTQICSTSNVVIVNSK